MNDHSLTSCVGCIIRIFNLLDSFGSVVQCCQVPSSHIESLQILNRVFCIEYIFINYECCSFFIASLSFSNLSDWSKLPEYIVQLFCSCLVWEVAYEDDFVDLRRKLVDFCCESLINFICHLKEIVIILQFCS